MNVEELLLQPLSYTLPDMDKQQVRKDILYKPVNGTDLRFDAYYPANFDFTSKLPAVVFLHGEASWELLKTAKDWGQYTSWAQLVAASGLIAVIPMRRSSDGYMRLEDVSGDVLDILTFLQTRADELHVNRENLGVWVCSAGGPAGLAPILANNYDYIRCIAAYYTAMDLERFDELRERISASVARKFSPIRQLGPSTPPMLIARAGLDSPAFNEPLDDFVTTALAMNLPVELINHPQGVHGFDIRNNDNRTNQMIRRTLEFFKDHLIPS